MAQIDTGFLLASMGIVFGFIMLVLYINRKRFAPTPEGGPTNDEILRQRGITPSPPRDEIWASVQHEIMFTILTIIVPAFFTMVSFFLYGTGAVSPLAAMFMGTMFLVGGTVAYLGTKLVMVQRAAGKLFGYITYNFMNPDDKAISRTRPIDRERCVSVRRNDLIKMVNLKRMELAGLVRTGKVQTQ